MVKIYDYGIDADDNQYIVGKLAIRKNKDGEPEEYIPRPKYYTSLTEACRCILFCEIRKMVHSEEMDLSGLVARIETKQQEFDRMCRAAFEEDSHV